MSARWNWTVIPKGISWEMDMWGACEQQASTCWEEERRLAKFVTPLPCRSPQGVVWEVSHQRSWWKCWFSLLRGQAQVQGCAVIRLLPYFFMEVCILLSIMLISEDLPGPHHESCLAVRTFCTLSLHCWRESSTQYLCNWIIHTHKPHIRYVVLMAVLQNPLGCRQF